MPSAELAPAPQPEIQEVSAERFPHFGIPGFETLPHKTQELYLKIPASRLDASRSFIEKEIAKASEGTEEISEGQTEIFQASTIETIARPRKEQANTAIETFHRAENGDPQAKKDLLDQKKELLGEEPSDDEIFQTLLEDQSGMFDSSLVLEVALSDADTQQHQDVLNLYKEFRGDMASVDEALKPQQQIELFIELTKSGGTLANRMFLGRKALTVLTSGGTRNLSAGLKALHVLDGGGILDAGVNTLRRMADSREVKAEYA